MTYKASPSYVTRTLQALDATRGGFAQPVTIQAAMHTWNMELYIGVEGQDWTPISKIEIKGNDAYFHVEYMDLIIRTEYVDAVRARVRKDR